MFLISMEFVDLTLNYCNIHNFLALMLQLLKLFVLCFKQDKSDLQQQENG